MSSGDYWSGWTWRWLTWSEDQSQAGDDEGSLTADADDG